ncbi:hypothetical protein ACGFZP_13025 [Kitasatospora sp. NPDC048239]|uniref:hypothetical protein n=1 Tax=Kitasatospora sp. NPDC048239 TaxID=3364046 RepID=UPI003711ECF7
MNNSLQWIRGVELRLKDKLIPSPGHQSLLLDQLANVRVAFDNGFVHVDTRSSSTVPPDPSGEYTVFVFPASVVESARYRVTESQPRVRAI